MNEEQLEDEPVPVRTTPREKYHDSPFSSRFSTVLFSCKITVSMISKKETLKNNFGHLFRFLCQMFPLKLYLFSLNF